MFPILLGLTLTVAIFAFGIINQHAKAKTILDAWYAYWYIFFMIATIINCIIQMILNNYLATLATVLIGVLIAISPLAFKAYQISRIK
jgi:hypothetical protein